MKIAYMNSLSKFNNKYKWFLNKNELAKVPNLVLPRCPVRDIDC